LSKYLSKDAFERARVFSYRAYRLTSLLARTPGWTRRLERVRGNANKVIMYMLHAHMLQDMFVDDPRWARSNAAPATDKPQAAACAVIA
jgi:hypothetical protein